MLATSGEGWYAPAKTAMGRPPHVRKRGCCLEMLERPMSSTAARYRSMCAYRIGSTRSTQEHTYKELQMVHSQGTMPLRHKCRAAARWQVSPWLLLLLRTLTPGTYARLHLGLFSSVALSCCTTHVHGVTSECVRCALLITVYG